VIRLGDKVQVQIAKVDSFKKQVDFRLARDERIESRPAQAKREFTPKRDFGQKQQKPQLMRSSHSSGKFQKRRRR
jgi:predicted RNA-binding protein with RPS1 domain